MLGGYKIQTILGREILDSRGNPTVACRVTLTNGLSAEAKVPSGASTGRHEALELRDKDKRYGGKGVQRAVDNVNKRMRDRLLGLDVRRGRDMDDVIIDLDGTDNKSNLGANATLAVSLAVAQVAALYRKEPLWESLRHTYRFPHKPSLPVATMNVLNGGVHADWSLDVQECMIIPKRRSMKERVRVGSEVFHALKKLLDQMGYATTVGDEGGFAPKLPRVEDAFGLLVKAIKKAGYKPGKDVTLGTDVAASEFYKKKAKRYEMKAEGKIYTAAQLLKRYEAWQKEFPLEFLEDPFDEDDWGAWEACVPVLKKKSAIVGDDFFVTNVHRLERGIREKAATAILIKLNQIGTLSETADAIILAHKNNFKTAISHRSGETSDTTIADLAVACGSEYIKTGSLSRSERVEKYNRLMEIELEMKG